MILHYVMIEENSVSLVLNLHYQVHHKSCPKHFLVTRGTMIPTRGWAWVRSWPLILEMLYYLFLYTTTDMRGFGDSHAQNSKTTGGSQEPNSIMGPAQEPLAGNCKGLKSMWTVYCQLPQYLASAKMSEFSLSALTLAPIRSGKLVKLRFEWPNDGFFSPWWTWNLHSVAASCLVHRSTL